ncbi:MAG: TIGR03089 family protein [Candidatus Nanopelagicales bacterium]
MAVVPAILDLLAAYEQPGRPWATAYGSFGRAELSVTSLINAVSKAANFLVEGLGCQPGESLSVDLPAHWQLPVWTFAGLTVGMAVGAHRTADVAVRVTAAGAAAGPAGEQLVVALDAFGMPLPGGAPTGRIDAAAEVRAHGDRWAGFARAGGGVWRAEDLVDQPAALAEAALLARRYGLQEHGRLLVAEPAGAISDEELLMATSLAPLSRMASLVVVAAGVDPAVIAAAEGVSARAR